MTDDKKNIPEAALPNESPASTMENAAVPEQPPPEPVLTNVESVMLKHEGQAALLRVRRLRHNHLQLAIPPAQKNGGRQSAHAGVST